MWRWAGGGRPTSSRTTARQTSGRDRSRFAGAERIEREPEDKRDPTDDVELEGERRRRRREERIRRDRGTGLRARREERLRLQRVHGAAPPAVGRGGEPPDRPPPGDGRVVEPPPP